MRISSVCFSCGDSLISQMRARSLVAIGRMSGNDFFRIWTFSLRCKVELAEMIHWEYFSINWCCTELMKQAVGVLNSVFCFWGNQKNSCCEFRDAHDCLMGEPVL